MIRWWNHAALATLTALWTSVLVATASHAQDAPPATPTDAGEAAEAPSTAPDDPPPPPAPPAPAPDTRRIASDGLARMAMTILRDQTNPTPNDYRITALTLRIAQRLNGARPDEELLRLEREAWQAAGDEAEAMALTREIVRVAPRDTVAMLSLLNVRIQALQDADQRLAAYGRLLGPEGASIDPSIRSRLALDAALIARENGDEAEFLRLLTEATTLDATNKDAAVFLATYLLDRTKDPRERADLLGNVILADPTDVNAYTNVAMEMFREGAFKGASRFFDCATNLTLAAGNNLSADDIFDRMLVTWLDSGEAAVQEQLEQILNQQRAMVQAERRRLEATGHDPQETREARLPGQYEMLRLAIAFAAGDTAALETSVANLAATNVMQREMIVARESPFDEWEEQDIQDALRQLRMEISFARLWAGVQTDEAQADIEALLSDEGREALGDAAAARFEALLAVRRGAADEALERLLALAEEDAAAALGAGIAYETLGQRQEAIRAYARLALQQPTSAIGVAARMRVQTLLGEPLSPTPAAAALNQWSRLFAPWLDRLTTGPRRYMALSAQHVRSRIDAFDRVEIDIQLRNSSRWPLAVGPSSPINSRLMITPRITVMGRDIEEMAAPEVVDLSRRLRLMPGEEFNVRMWASRGPVGTMVQLTAVQATKLRWRVLQGYRMNEMRMFTSGPLELSAETDLLSIATIADRTDAEAIDEIRSATGRRWFEAMLVAQGSGARRRPGEPAPANAARRQAFAQALADRLPSLEEFEKVWALTVALPGGMFHVPSDLLFVAGSDPSPFVKAALLVGPYRSDVSFDVPDLSDDADPDIAQIATMVNRARALRDGGGGG